MKRDTKALSDALVARDEAEKNKLKMTELRTAMHNELWIKMEELSDMDAHLCHIIPGRTPSYELPKRSAKSGSEPETVAL